ncbi:MAG: LytTR family DNA-binding domain-containing protein [Cyclobacteriaceae bacterium]|nr:LytTR family DNA-binding domain-containing protein [Cyclobacteriaceae bacterium]
MSNGENLKVLIVDDEPLARNLLADYVSKVPFLELIDTCPNPVKAMEVMRLHPVDVLFLDIQMPEITGISFLKILQQKPYVILTTAYSEYALESFDLDVTDYLLKPVTFDRFMRAVERVNQRRKGLEQSPAPRTLEEDSSYVFIKDGTKLVKVRWADILYVEGLKDYVTIHTRTQKVITLQRLKVLEDQLPPERFIRIHNSFIVAIDAIEVVHKNEVQIGQAMIPVSDTYKKAFRDLIDRKHLQ